MEWRSRWGTYRGGLQCWQQVAHAACVTLPRAVALAATLRAGRGSWSSMATEEGVAFPLSPPSSGCWGLSSACLRVTPPLHLHVLRRQHRHGLLCVTLLCRAHRHWIRHIIRGRVSSPRGARYQHAPDLEEDDLHPQPTPIRSADPALHADADLSGPFVGDCVEGGGGGWCAETTVLREEASVWRRRRHGRRRSGAQELCGCRLALRTGSLTCRRGLVTE
jgi:hypothetical protein